MFITKPSLLAKPLLILLGLVGVLLAAQVNAAAKDEIAARLTPVGKVCVVGDECAKGVKITGAAGAAKTPDQIYNTFCQVCHAKGLNNAPIFADAKAWAPHIAKGKDVLYQSALNGFNNGAMPPRGTCADCTDDEIKATVDYLISSAKK